VGDKKIRRDYLEMYQDENVRDVFFEQGIFSSYGPKKRRLSEKDIVFQFIEIASHKWLLIGAAIITDTENEQGYNEITGVIFKAAEYEKLPEYEQYYNRVIVDWTNKPQQFFYIDSKIIDEVEVSTVLAESYLLEGTAFPGFENLNVTYKRLKLNIDKQDWKSALSSIYGVYVITDTNNGKLYVGSAYGKNGIYGRWKVYLMSGYDKDERENGEYPNKQLKKLVKREGMLYIQNYFKYTLLEVYPKNEIGKEKTLLRESYWKEVLETRRYGYNEN